MRIKARRGWASFGVALLMMVACELPAGRAAEERSETAWLGVYSQEITPELRDGMNHASEGVLVNRVVPDSPADRAGIRKGDVIVRVNSRLVNTPDELSRIVRAGHVGDPVAIRIVRDGNQQTLTARLAARPEEDSEAPEARESRRSHETPDPDFDFDFDFDGGPGSDGESFEIPGDGFAMLGMGRGRLGVRIQSLNTGLGDYFGVKDGKGVLVVDVLKDTPAERAGLKSGDVITRVGDRDVNDADDLIRAIRSSEGKVTIGVVRHNTRRTIEAELKPAPRPPRVLRLRRGNGAGSPGSWSWSETPDREELRRDLRELREELRGLKKELEELKQKK